MKRVYLYNGKEYSTEREVRRALWESEHKVFAKEPSSDIGVFWSALGVEYSEAESVKTEPFVEPDTVLAARAREKRNSLLYATDHYFLMDSPVSGDKLEALKVYRQALRDVPQQEGFPHDVVFPEKPEV